MSSLLELSRTPVWEWPSNAQKTLREALTSGVEADQLMAADLVGESWLDDSLAEAILTILSESASEALRASAAIALGPGIEEADLFSEDFDDEPGVTPPMIKRIHEKLESLYRDATAPKLVRRRALEASIRAPQDWHPDAVRAAWKSGDREWMATAVFCMGFTPGFDKEILEALETSDGPLFMEAVRAAGAASVTAAEGKLIALASSKNTERDLRLLAIEALGGAGDAAATDALLELTQSADLEIGETASAALTMLEGDLMADDEDDA